MCQGNCKCQEAKNKVKLRLMSCPKSGGFSSTDHDLVVGEQVTVYVEAGMITIEVLPNIEIKDIEK